MKIEIPLKNSLALTTLGCTALQERKTVHAQVTNTIRTTPEGCEQPPTGCSLPSLAGAQGGLVLVEELAHNGPSLTGKARTQQKLK